jgi:hypothetical protein
MYNHRFYHLALAQLVLYVFAAALLAGVVAWATMLTAAAALGALVAFAVLFAGMAFLHSALREARWDAGHRLH